MPTSKFSDAVELMPRLAGDAAGLGTWDTGDSATCRGIRQPTDSWKDVDIEVTTAPQVRWGVFTQVPTDRMQLFLVTLAPTNGSPTAPSMRIIVSAGTTASMTEVALGSIVGGKPWADTAGRLLMVSGFPAYRWEITIWSDPSDPDFGPARVGIRALLDRVGGGILTVDKSGGIVS